MTKQMLTAQLGGYGLGLWIGGKGKAATFSHPGKNEGFICMLFAYLETGQGAVKDTRGNTTSMRAMTSGQTVTARKVK